MRLLQEYCALLPKHASHRPGEAVQRDSGQPLPRHPNIVIAHWSCHRVRHSNPQPSCAASHSPSLRAESHWRGMLDGKISSICKWFADAGSEICHTLAYALRFLARENMLQNYRGYTV